MEGFDYKQGDLIRKLKWLGGVRFSAILLFLIGYLVVRRLDLIVFPTYPFLFLCVVEALNQPYFAAKYSRDLNRLLYASFVLDVMLITGIIHFLGGIEFSLLSPIYPMIIILASMLIGEDAGFRIATLSSMFYMTMIAFEYVGIIGHIPLLGLKLDGLHQLAIASANIFFFYLIAYISNYSSGAIKEKKDEANKAKDYTEAIIGNMREGLFIMDKNGTILNLNKAAKRILKFDDDEPIGNRILDKLCPSESRFKLNELLSGAGRSEETALFLLDKSGGKVPVKCNTFQVRNLSGDLETAMIVRDVSEEKNADRVRGDFLSDVSRRLHASLAAVKGAAGGEESRKLERVIGDLSDLSTIEAGCIELQKRKQDLLSIIQSVIEDHKAEAKLKKILLQIELPKALPALPVDGEKIKMVFSCLLSNAIRFTPEGGRVEVEAKDEGDHVKVDVSDTGAGISEEEMPKIFDYVPGALKEGASSVKLKLPMSRCVIDAHGGLITVTSQAGEGSTFSVMIPKD